MRGRALNVLQAAAASGQSRIDHKRAVVGVRLAAGLAAGFVVAWAGVPSPVASGLLAIAGAALGQRLESGERTLTGLGLARLSRQALQLLLHEGLR